MSDNVHAVSATVAARLPRALVVDPNSGGAKILAELLRSIVPNCQVMLVQSEQRAFELMESFNPQLIFVEYKGATLDGLEFTRALRHSYLPCRAAPVIVVTAEATAAAIMGARDAGVHEFLRRPYTFGDLKKRIDAVVIRPRDWIEGVNYVGPDRRRFNSADYKGPRKRRAEGASPVAQRIAQAIKIVQAAAAASHQQPQQAMRALQAQCRILAGVSVGRPAFAHLRTSAAALEAYLVGPARADGLSRQQIENFAAQLLAAAPEEKPTQAA